MTRLYRLSNVSFTDIELKIMRLVAWRSCVDGKVNSVTHSETAIIEFYCMKNFKHWDTIIKRRAAFNEIIPIKQEKLASLINMENVCQKTLLQIK